MCSPVADLLSTWTIPFFSSFPLFNSELEELLKLLINDTHYPRAY